MFSKCTNIICVCDFSYQIYLERYTKVDKGPFFLFVLSPSSPEMPGQPKYFSADIWTSDVATF